MVPIVMAEQYLLAKEKLKQLDLRDLEANKIRAKAQFSEDGERSTRYFFSLEKKRKAEQTISLLTKENMDTVKDMKGLLSETQPFYKELFSAQPCDEAAQNAFLSVPFPKLSECDRESCDRDLTEEELRKAVLSMENDKSPGIDGLTNNFYKHLWPILGEKLTQVYNYAFCRGEVSLRCYLKKVIRLS